MTEAELMQQAETAAAISAQPGDLKKWIGAMIKKGFPQITDPDLGQEYMWVEITGTSGQRLIGRLRNQPWLATQLSLNDEVEVEVGEIFGARWPEWLGFDGDKPWPRPWPEELPPAAFQALPLTKELQARLRQIRERQRAEHKAGRPQACRVFHEAEVVCLRARGRGGMFLGIDGRLLFENDGERETFSHPRDMAFNIVRCAAAIGVPELIDLLPPKPENGFTCRMCDGTRRQLPQYAGGVEPDWCPRCSGLGWTMAERVPDAEPAQV